MRMKKGRKWTYNDRIGWSPWLSFDLHTFSGFRRARLVVVEFICFDSHADGFSLVYVHAIC